jgi:hypothetical protein
LLIQFGLRAGRPDAILLLSGCYTLETARSRVKKSSWAARANGWRFGRRKPLVAVRVLTASLLPAQRASRVAPVEALREE